MATEKIATGIGFIPTFILASAIGYLLYRFIKPADWCEKNLQNHLRRYFAYAVLGATYASISPFYRYPFDQAVSTALAGVALVFCLAGLVALITWFFGSKSRSVTKAAVPETQHNHSPTQSQTRESYYEEKGTTMSEKESEPISSPDTNAIYAEIAEEIESNNTDKGLWTRLFAECDGDEKRTEVQYIKRRAAHLMEVERTKNAVKIAEFNRVKEEEQAAIAAERKRTMEERVRQQLSEQKARAEAHEAVRTEQFKEKEKDALSRLPIEKDGDRYRVSGVSYYDLDDAINYARRIQSGNPWDTLSAESSNPSIDSKIKFLGAKIFVGVAIFLAGVLAVFLGWTDHSESQKTKAANSPGSTPTSYSASDQIACIQMARPSVADLCSKYSGANEFCKSVILSVLEYKGYPSLIQGCPVVKSEDVATSYYWGMKNAVFKGVLRQGTFENCCFDGKAIAERYYYLELPKSVVINPDPRYPDTEPKIEGVDVIALGLDDPLPNGITVGQPVLATCKNLWFGATGHYPLPSSCTFARIRRR